MRIPRTAHPISRTAISEPALRVLYRLQQENFQAHLVGGGVRDLLLGIIPKDFDIATDARPEQVRQVFRNCRLIGRRFRLAHVYFGQDIIEVATFRGCNEDADPQDRCLEHGMLVRDNCYGTLAEDALRRDFTVNALYYDIADRSLIDYTDGLNDLKQKRLRLIGEPTQRYREDPVRMLRAVRFACKLDFMIDPATESPLFKLGNLLAEISHARLFDELLKLFYSGKGFLSFEKLRYYNLFTYLFPETEQCLTHSDPNWILAFIQQSLANTDQRVQTERPVNPAFLFATLLWGPVYQKYTKLLTAGHSSNEAILLAADAIIQKQITRVAIPRRFSLPMREIWALQPKFAQRSGKRAFWILSHPRFRAAYDFLLLRTAVGENDPILAEWWTRFQNASNAERIILLKDHQQPKKSRRRRKNRVISNQSKAS